MFRPTLCRRSSSIKHLQAAFADSRSPFHIPPGEKGPASPHEHLPSIEDSADQGARIHPIEQGYDPDSLWEQPIVWGDHDAFQHVNNVRYARFIESARIRWMSSFGDRIGGKSRAEAMLRGKGVSLILKSLTIDYKYPVTYPDTLLVGHKPDLSIHHSRQDGKDTKTADTPKARTSFKLHAALYSYAQKRTVADSTSLMVWYDYDNPRKCDPGQEVWDRLKEYQG